MKTKSLIIFALLIIMVVGCGSNTDTASNENVDTNTHESVDDNSTENDAATEDSTDNEASADGETLVLTATSPAVEGSLTYKNYEIFKEEVENNSDGRLSVDIYAGGTLVSGDREGIEALQRGDVDFLISSTAPYVSFAPSMAIYDIPFLFPSTEIAFEVTTQGEVIKEIEEDLRAQGMEPVGYTLSGFRQLTTNAEVRTPDDLQGVKIRTMENPNHMTLWETLGANPSPISFSELYTALEQGTIDAQENPVSLIYDTKFFEVQDYLILTGHISAVGQAVFGKATFDSLPDDLQKVVKDAGQVMSEKALQLAMAEEEDYMNMLEESGMEIIELSDEEREAFKEKAQPVVLEAIGEQVGQDLVNRLVDEIDEISSGN